MGPVPCRIFGDLWDFLEYLFSISLASRQTWDRSHRSIETSHYDVNSIIVSDHICIPQYSIHWIYNVNIVLVKLIRLINMKLSFHYCQTPARISEATFSVHKVFPTMDG